MTTVTSNTHFTNTLVEHSHTKNMHLTTSNLAVSNQSKNPNSASMPLASLRAPPKGARYSIFDYLAQALPVVKPMTEEIQAVTEETQTVTEEVQAHEPDTDTKSVVSSRSKATTSRARSLDPESFKVLEDFVKAVTPDSNTQYSIMGALKTRHDWAGRVLVNENITRSPLRAIAKTTEGFTLLKKRIINAFTKVLGDKVFVSVNVYDVEHVPTQVFLKVRVSRMRERVTEASVVPVKETEVKPAKAPKAPKVKATQSRFAALAESDTDDE
jgi:hypothetical protein